VSDNKAISSNGNSYFVIGANYTFRLKGFENAKSVFLAGDFNDWSPNTFKMERSGDEWLLKVHLTPGKHLYKFIIDGKWILDPANKLWEQNKENTGNSVIWIEKNPVM
jgi:1,4-alpha-glucan branching enzyme